MTVMAAVALGGLFTGCNKDVDLSGNTAELDVVKNYEDAFVTRFGQPHENQTWGFGEAAAETRALTRGVNANGNMWASEEGGNWKVPTQLTEEQKNIVRQYFQQNKPIGYKDPQWENYFIQQVYKGHTNTAGSLSPEEYTSANNGKVVGSDHMDHLAACNADGTIKDHIYNYNFGTCSTYGNVLNSSGVTYYNSDGTSHPDEIQLMVGSTTAKFGYFNSDGSLGHTEYTGLVGWETIRTWANGKGLNGDCLEDGWNRSFMGFDFEQVVGDDVYDQVNVVWENGKKKSYDIHYAKYSEAPETPQYIWDGQNVIPLNSTSRTFKSETNLMNRFSYTWNDKETLTDNSDGTLKTYTAVKHGGMAAWFSTEGDDLSSYDKLVFELSEGAPNTTQVLIQYINSEGKDDSYYFSANTWTTKIECDFSGKDVTKVKQIALQMTGDRDANWNNYTFKFSKIYFESSTTEEITGVGEYMYYNKKQVPYLSSDQNTYCGDFLEYTSDDDVKIRKQFNGTEVVCLNWKKLVDERLSQGYLPVVGSSMKKWVKVHGGADGYHSDWIVTLTKAENNTTTPPPSTSDDIVCRIIVEDLTVGESSDFDFNDVVFDVRKDGTLIIRAIGGELPIYIGAENANEVHAACSITLSGNTNQGKNSHRFMRNTGWQSDANSKVYEGIDYNADLGHIKLSGTFNTPADAQKIGIWVHKNGENIKLKAPRGKVASMVCVGTDYKWCAERQDIDDKYHKGGVRLFREYVIGNPDYQGDWKDKNAWYHKMNQ